MTLILDYLDYHDIYILEYLLDNHDIYIVEYLDDHDFDFRLSR